LLIAPVPTHPGTTGASTRIRLIADVLRARGHEVHFLHLQQSLRPPDGALHRYWGDRLHEVRGLGPRSWLARGRRKAVRLMAKSLGANVPVDAYFDRAADAALRVLLARIDFDVVMLSYVFYSKLFEAVPSRTRKVLDTHDVFSDRYRLYREHGQAAEFFSTTPAEEAKALARADVVVAIQPEDAAHFRTLTDRTVTVVGHLAAPVPAAAMAGPLPPEPVVLFVGGPMGINVHGVRWFIDEVLPAIRRAQPAAELWLAGGIGRRVPPAPGVRRLGFVADLGDVYRKATVVVNPQQFGTGLSIKCVEALAHGRPLVTTPCGARGLDEGANTAFHVGRSAEEFAAHVVGLLRDPARAAETAAVAAAFAAAYYRSNVDALDAVLQVPAR
jgi:glycosyltransferase involved in cell wall biosynthesis